MAQNKAHHILQRMIFYNGRDAHRIQHALKVFAFAQHIGVQEKCSAQLLSIIEYAAALHDIGIHVAEDKYLSSAGKLQEIEGPPIAREMLTAEGVPADTIERVCFIIAHHHTFDSIDGVDFQIVVESDFLVNIYDEDLDKKAVASLGTTIFKTKTGTALLESIYKAEI
jgi:hypothetical protein